MEKSDKRRCKHVAPQPNSMIAKYGNYGDDKMDCWRKYRQGRDLPVCHERSERRQSNPPFDTTTDHRCSDSHRLRKHHGLPGSLGTNKHLDPPLPEEAYRLDSKNHSLLRALGSQFYQNVAIVRKPRYKNEVDADENPKSYAEPAVDDNVEEETGDEVVDEEHEIASEYSDKEYEEQEADDEVDEESDVLEQQTERPMRTQRKHRIEPLQRGQRTSAIVEPSHSRRGRKMAAEKDSERCCRNAAERDNVDVPSEVDDDDQDLCEPAIHPRKKAIVRYQPMQRDRECRNQTRHFVERYSNGSASGLARQRPRTTKPDGESSMALTRLPHATIRNNRCSHCGISTGQATKTTASRNAGCRLQDNRFFTRGPIGDEGVDFEDPEPVISYQTKPRRSKGSRSPSYDPREETRRMDAELGTIYNKTCRSKNPRDSSSGIGERARQSLRANNRHDPTTSLKNANHYWP